MVGKPVNPKCGLLVECVGNRHDDKLSTSKYYFIICGAGRDEVRVVVGPGCTSQVHHGDDALHEIGRSDDCLLRQAPARSRGATFVVDYWRGISSLVISIAQEQRNNNKKVFL